MIPILSVERFLRSQRGNIVIMAALFLPVALMSSGLIIDTALLNIQKRKLQNAADMAAISAATHLDNAETVARATLSDNGLVLATDSEGGFLEEDDLQALAAGEALSRVELGQYRFDASVPVAERFIANQTPYNAVRVTVGEDSKRHFASGHWLDKRITRSAVATKSPRLAYSVGSRLFALREGVANQLLSALTGSNVGLTVMDYNALAGADISLLTYLKAVAIEADIDAVTYDDILDEQVTLGELADALDRAAPGSAKAAAHKLAVDLQGATRQVRLGDFIRLSTAGARTVGPLDGDLTAVAPVDIEANLMEILTAGLLFANSNRQISLDLSNEAPGLSELDLTLAIGERMQHSGWVRLGHEADVLQTAQTRLKLVGQIGGEPLLPNASLRLPVHAELAWAEAKVDTVGCEINQPAYDSARILARPGIARLWIGETSSSEFVDFTRELSPHRTDIVTLPLTRVRGSAAIEVGNTQPVSMQFSASDIRYKRVKSASTGTALESLSGSLLGDLDLDVEIVGIGLSTGSRTKEKVAETLAVMTPSLDAVLNDLIGLLGVGLGEMDVKVHGVQCQFASLAQ